MKRRIKKDMVLILLGVAIVAIPFLLRMKEQERSNRYMKAFEEEQNEEKQNKKDHKKKDSLLLQEGVIGIIEIPSLDIKYRGEHSKKPDEIRDRIVELCGNLPRIELFARKKSEGWECLGNEIDGKDIREALKVLLEEDSR